jgi:hypothetical protein
MKSIQNINVILSGDIINTVKPESIFKQRRTYIPAKFSCNPIELLISQYRRLYVIALHAFLTAHQINI